MSKFYHFNPPKRENYRTEEEYEGGIGRVGMGRG